MKCDEQTDCVAVDRPETPRSIKVCLNFVQKRLSLLNETIIEKFEMPATVLTSIRVGLVCQYIGISTLLYAIATNSWLVSGHIQCSDDDGKSLNGSEGLIIAAMCRDSVFRDRFSRMYLLLEMTAVVFLVAKLAIAIGKLELNLEDYINMKLDERSMFWILFLPRLLCYIFLPIESIMTANLSTAFASFLSIFQSPISFMFSLGVRIITLPISIFFPSPLRDKFDIDFPSLAKHLGKSERQDTCNGVLSNGIIVDCFEKCRLSLEPSWFISVVLILFNFSIVYWFLGVSSRCSDDKGRALDSRDNFSEGVEFIRVSEVSEDFSYEDDGGERDHETSLKDLKEELKESEEIVKSDEFKGVLSTEPLVSESVSSGLEVLEGSITDGDAGSLESSKLNEDAVDREVPEQDREISKAKDDEIIQDANLANLHEEEGKNVAEMKIQSVKSTQTFTLKLNKGCQTFAPIHLHKKVNKKTQVSPILVDAEINTDAVNSVEKKEGGSQIEYGRFKQSKVVDANGKINIVENGKSIKDDGNDKELQIRDNREIENRLKQDQFGNGNDHMNDVAMPSDSNDLLKGNGSVGKELFGFSELALIPRTLDFERRIIREKQIQRIDVESFLKFLEKEDDKDIIFVEKDLLIDTIRSIVLTTKMSTTEENVCERSGDFVDRCDCRVHVLIKRFTKHGRHENDEVDGLKMETEDDDFSDDESFFNGFRL